jgi:hypothetical protein
MALVVLVGAATLAVAVLSWRAVRRSRAAS